MKKSKIAFWLLVSAVYLLPLFFIPGLGLVDDAHSVFLSRDFFHLDVDGMARWFREVESGRFRPFYALAMAAFGLLGPEKPFLWVVGRWLMMSAIPLLGEMVLAPHINGKARKAILLAAFLWPSWAANMYRFGTAEPLQLVFLLLTLLALQRGKKLLSVLAWIGALWSKETTVFLTPLIMWWQWQYTTVTWSKKMIDSVAFVVTALLTVLLIPPVSGYSMNVIFDFRHWLHIVFVHAPTAWPETYYGLLLSLALWAMIFGNAIRAGEPLQKLRRIASVCLGAILALVPVVMWRLPQERYLLVVNFFLTLSLGLAAVEWRRRFVEVRHKPRWYFAVSILLLLLIPPQHWLRSLPAMTIRSGGEIQNWVQNFSEHSSLSLWLRQKQVEKVYIETGNEEFVYAIGLYTSHFQPDLTGLTVISVFHFPYSIYRQSPSVLNAFLFECNPEEPCFFLSQKPLVGHGVKTMPIDDSGWYVAEKKEP